MITARARVAGDRIAVGPLDRPHRGARGPLVPASDDDPVTPFWHGAILLRVVTLLFAIGIIWVRRERYLMPSAAWATAVAMTLWTVVLVGFYRREDGRRRWLVVTDLVLSCAMMVASIPITGRDALARQATLITSLWSSGPVVGAAIYGGRYYGLAFGAVTAAADLVPRSYFDVYLAEDTVLLLGVGFVVGVASEATKEAAARGRRALSAQAAAAERERLARSIHDGVLQVLSRIRRSGLGTGTEAVGLARLVEEQEAALRALITSGPMVATVDDAVDLRSHLRMLSTPSVQVSVPPTRVMVAMTTTAELLAATREALSNVTRHAGVDANAWVLLEDLGDELVLSVRDDGVGIPPGRLVAAVAEGRFGVSKSIKGRIADLGGTVVLTTAEGEGTEWELHVPAVTAT